MKQDQGSGEYLRLYMGASSMEKSILVDESDAEKATALIQNVQEVSDSDIDETEEGIKPKNKLASRIIVTMFLSMFFILFVTLLIFWIMELFTQ